MMLRISIVFLSFWTGLWAITDLNEKIDEADQAFKDKKYVQAISQYHFILDSLASTDPAIRLNLAHAFYNINDTLNLEEAYSWFNSSKHPKLESIAQLQLGVSNYKKNHGSLEITPKQSPKDENEKAFLMDCMEYFKEALRKNPENNLARYNYELLYHHFHHSEPKDDKEQEQEKQEQEQQEQEQKQDQQDQKNQDQKQDQNNQDQQNQDQQNQDQKKENQENKDGQKNQDKDGEPDKKDQQGQNNEGKPDQKEGDKGEDKNEKGKKGEEKSDQDKDGKGEGKKEQKEEKKGEQGEEQAEQKGQKGKEGKEGEKGKNEGQAPSPQQLQAQRLKEMKMSKEQRDKILRSIKTDERQFLMQLDKRKPQQAPDPDKPDW